jgi:hypothetical protein
MCLKEVSNLKNNPNVKLVPQNGWYEMQEIDKSGKEVFSIGVGFSEEMGSWGYWNADNTTGKRKWMEVEVPEVNPTLVIRETPYSEEEREWIDEYLPVYAELFEYYAQFLPGLWQQTNE